MRFPREFRGYISNPRALAAARILPIRWAYAFQLHVFVAFMVSLVLMPEVVGILEKFADAVAQIPAGITLEKKGSELNVTGLKQPFTATTTQGALTIDTTGALQTRPTSSAAFISKTGIDFMPDASKPASFLPWSEMSDLKITSDQLRSALTDHFTLFVTVMAVAMFVYFFVTSAIVSAILILGFSIVTVVVQRLVYKHIFPMRDIVAMNTVAITAPVVLWGIFTVLGLPIGMVVEVTAFIVYSVVGMRTGLEWLVGEQPSSDEQSKGK